MWCIVGEIEYVQLGLILLPRFVEGFLHLPLHPLQEGIQWKHQDVTDVLHLDNTQTVLATGQWTHGTCASDSGDRQRLILHVSQKYVGVKSPQFCDLGTKIILIIMTVLIMISSNFSFPCSVYFP